MSEETARTVQAGRRWPGPEVAPYKHGSLMDWVDATAFRKRETRPESFAYPQEWRPNEPFEAELTLTGIERGRSAARFTWKDIDGNTYPMFLTDMADLVMSEEGVRQGRAEGHWIVVKRGQNFGIMRLREWW